MKRAAGASRRRVTSRHSTMGSFPRHSESGPHRLPSTPSTARKFAVSIVGLHVPLLFLGCSSPDRARSADRSSESLEVVWSSTVTLGAPIAVEVVGPWLVVLDAFGDSVLTLLNRGDGRFIGRLGRRGEGAGEFVGPQSITRDARATAFWVHDMRLGRITRFELDSHGAARDTTMVRFNVPATILDPHRIEGGFVTLGLFDGGRLAFVGDSGQLRRYAGDVPRDPSRSDVPPSVLQHAFQASLAVGPSGAPLVVANRHASLIELYGRDGVVLRVIDGPGRIRPVYDVRATAAGPALTSGDDLVFGYIDVVVTERAILALFSGRRRRDFPGRANFAQTIHVFRHGGGLASVATLPGDAIAIALSATDSLLYVAVHDPEPAIVAVDARTLLR